MTVQRLLIDGGTTSTRVWAVDGTTVLAEARAMVGARDSAREGSNEGWIRQLRELIAQADGEARKRVSSWQPSCVVAAGMITSPLGLAEVPHVPAPAGISALAAGVRRLAMPGMTSLPVLLVPGVRCGPAIPTLREIGAVDVMRGEEVVCLGLVQSGLLPKGGVALSVGSHWKVVEIGEDGSILGAATTLSGELLHALRTQTVLAASVAPALPDLLDDDDLVALRLGMSQQGSAGFSRAAFCTRLLERVPDSTPRTRLLFLLGVVVGETLAHWSGMLQGRSIALLGAPALCQAWETALTTCGSRGITAKPDQVVAAYAAGMGAVMDALTD